MWARWVGMLLGIWLVISPGVFHYADDTAVWNDVWVGIAVMAVTALSLLYSAAEDAQLLLAGWLLAAPWVAGYGYSAVGAAINDTVVGLLLLGCALYARRRPLAREHPVHLRWRRLMPDHRRWRP